MSGADERPLIAHVMYRFHIGGLENGVVNLINHLPEGRYRHAVIALDECDEQFTKRVRRDDVEFVSMRKPAGQGVKLFPRFFRLMRRLSPAIVHTRNLASLEMVVPACAARVPIRIHGEHGWDSSDPDGKSRKFQMIRRMYSPFVTQYIALSGHLASYLTRDVGVNPRRVTRICNGVNAERFVPRAMESGLDWVPSGFSADRGVVIGCVGRLERVKDQLTLLDAFALLRTSMGSESRSLRLVLVGDGPLRDAVLARINELGLADAVWLAGARDDVHLLMNAMDIFVLPSMAEGISNTILEAMASGLPVVATDVGGNGELVEAGKTGTLVPAGDAQAMAEALRRLVEDGAVRLSMAAASRARIEAEFSLDAMVRRYMNVYDGALARSGLMANT